MDGKDCCGNCHKNGGCRQKKADLGLSPETSVNIAFEGLIMSETTPDGNVLPPPENIKTFGKQVFITARWLAARFKIPYETLSDVISEIEHDARVYRVCRELWIGDDAFVEIYQHPRTEAYFDEAARGTVLQLLGHYREMAA